MPLYTTLQNPFFASTSGSLSARSEFKRILPRGHSRPLSSSTARKHKVPLIKYWQVLLRLRNIPQQSLGRFCATFRGAVYDLSESFTVAVVPTSGFQPGILQQSFECRLFNRTAFRNSHSSADTRSRKHLPFEKRA